MCVNTLLHTDICLSVYLPVIYLISLITWKWKDEEMIPIEQHTFTKFLGEEHLPLLFSKTQEW